jgi:hypothetical protein
MPGIISDEKTRKSPETLFDLTPEDEDKLRESDLLDLVNFGQVSKPVLVPGVNGRKYTVEISLLWDEDYIDILKKTMSYAADPLLRTRVLRRLKLHKAIQRIDAHDYSDSSDVASQRELWLILSKLSDSQVDVLGRHYEIIESERNVMVAQALELLNDALDATTPAPYKKDISETDKPHTDHAAILAGHQQDMSQLESELAHHGISNQVKTQPVKSRHVEDEQNT